MWPSGERDAQGRTIFPSYDNAPWGSGGTGAGGQPGGNVLMNGFFVVSCFHRSEAGLQVPSRSGACFAGLLVLMIDDVGTGPGAKIGWDRLSGKILPTWVLETSPGNFQVAYLLRYPITDRARAEALIKAMLYDGLGQEKDSGMLSVTRYMRMLVGINGKAKYQDPSITPGAIPGMPFVHRLHHWAPEQRYEEYEICQSFGLDLNRYVATAGNGREGDRYSSFVTEADDDPWYEVLSVAVPFKGGLRSKGSGDSVEVWQDISCPWVASHDRGQDDGAAYRLGGGFKCHHGHCDKRTFVDLRELLRSGFYGPEVKEMADKVYWDERFDPKFLESLEELPAMIQAGLVRDVPVFAKQPPPPRLDFDAMIAAARALQPTTEGKHIAELKMFINALAQYQLSLDSPEMELIFSEIAGATTVPIKSVRADYRRAYENVQRNRMLKEAQARKANAVMLCNGIKIPVIRGEGWPRRDDKGNPLPVTDNVEVLLRESGGEIWFNEMTHCEELRGGFKNVVWMETLDEASETVSDWAYANFLTMPSHLIAKKLRLIAKQNKYHPFRNFLEHDLEPWDGLDRLEGEGGLFSTIPVLPDECSLRNRILRKWLYSVIAAARHLYKDESGWQPRGVLVFRGDQHGGKTTWLARLFRGLFTGSHRCFLEGAKLSGDKDSKLEVLSSLAVELGEIDTTTKKAQSGDLKAFISAAMDRIRRPYAMSHVDIYRRTVFAGTANVEFLRDPSGNTRFWGITCSSKIDLDAQRTMDMRQIWAQIDAQCLHEFEEMRRNGDPIAPWLFNGDDVKEIEKSNDSHRVIDEVEGWLLEAFDWESPERSNAMTLAELKRMCTDQSVLRCRRSEWLAALRRLTQKPAAAKTTVPKRDSDGNIVFALDGKPLYANGRFWMMPDPVRLLTEDEVNSDLNSKKDSVQVDQSASKFRH